MKIVNFKSGLGNQFFYYLMYLYLQEKCPNEKVYGYYNPKFLDKHNGLELQNLLNITLPPASKTSNMVAAFCRIVSKVFRGLKADDEIFTQKAVYYDGWWQDKRFFLGHQQSLEFKKFQLDEKNKFTLDLIEHTNSVSIHIRRGDYLEGNNVTIYGGICTLQYYEEAVKIVNHLIKDPHFFVFSNDMEWAKKNIHLPKATFVSDNGGNKSHLDLYLMAHCKANIIANSSFSYWAAMMNRNPSSIVIYPKIWNHYQTPDIFPERWIKI